MRAIDDHEKTEFTFNDAENISALGLKYNRIDDYFYFKVEDFPTERKVTKRNIISSLAKVFDPVGLLCGIILTYRKFYQTVCLLKLDWDDEVPEEIKNQWFELKNDLKKIEKLKINRWSGYEPESQPFLIGFADGSFSGSSCVIYLRTIKNNQVSVKLITGKARVAPSNRELTIPKLELISTLMLAELMVKTADAMNLKISKETVALCTDSSIALSWITDLSRIHTRKIFVGSRVTLINKTIDSKLWYHVNSLNNAADKPSRLMSCDEIINCEEYWNGPKFLYEEPLQLNSSTFYTDEETKKESFKTPFVRRIHVENNEKPDWTELYSSYDKLIRVTVWLSRWRSKKRGSIEINEINDAEIKVIRFIQQKYFKEEINKIKHKILLKPEWKCLGPYIDNDNVIRMTGRLHNMQEMPLEQRHPAILPPLELRVGEEKNQ